MPVLVNYARLSDAQAHRLVREVQVLHTLEEVVHFGLAQTPAKMILDVVVQDEYCHDVVMEWQGGLYLAFDTT